MKIPCTVWMTSPESKAAVDAVINEMGYAKDVNQAARTVFCRDLAGKPFQIVVFHSRPHLAEFLSHTEGETSQ